MEYKWQNQAVPAKTAGLAKKVFKKGNQYLKIRDELGIVFTNEKFKHLFSHQGRTAVSSNKSRLSAQKSHPI
jgi:hypothetical protein